MTLLKRLIAPIQARLLEKHQCPACTRSLDKSIRREPVSNDSELVTCQCGRKFMFTKSVQRYRRQVEAE